ncbi:MAG: hypothetical protein UV97_C0023G0005 [Candidatus Yanofskybacteria bacterium GW2011_GWF2_43_596]|nr:MAG: hypothetical protein UV97_C0023G0005 [Candidatus Yanofskybacteria bacterium GW2011_GWF2_43_596]
MLEEVKRIKPSDPTTYYNLAVTYRAMDDRDEALKNIKDGMSLPGLDAELAQAFAKLLDGLK